LEFISAIKKLNYECLFIDDGSYDGTTEIIKKSNVNYIRNERNFGKGYSLKIGFNYAIVNNYDCVITIDADNQHPIEYIPLFVEKLKFFDIVIGSRKKQMNIRKMPIDRYISNRFNSAFISILCLKNIPDAQSGYRGMKIDVIKNLRINSNGFDFETEFIIKAIKKGYKVGYIDIPIIYNSKKSHIKKFKDTLKVLKVYLNVIFHS